jgi:hypothetical protein
MLDLHQEYRGSPRGAHLRVALPCARAYLTCLAVSSGLLIPCQYGPPIEFILDLLANVAHGRTIQEKS